MIFRSVLIALASVSALAAQEPPVKLPIEVPRQASVNFEAEGSGKQFLSTVKHLMSGDIADPTAPPADKVTIKTQYGNVDVKLDDLKPLLEKIHSLHIVSYTAVPNEDPFKHHEKQFSAAGLERVAFVPGPNGVLIMRHVGQSDRYGIVVRQKENVVVLRTDGAPGLGDFGRVLFEGLSRAVQQAVAARHHG